MSKDNNELLWMAVVGVTEQYINSKGLLTFFYLTHCLPFQVAPFIEECLESVSHFEAYSQLYFLSFLVDQDTYCEVVHGTLQSHVSRLNAGNREEQAAAGLRQPNSFPTNSCKFSPLAPAVLPFLVSI